MTFRQWGNVVRVVNNWQVHVIYFEPPCRGAVSAPSYSAVRRQKFSLNCNQTGENSKQAENAFSPIVEQKIVWQQGSGNPENPNHLATIREWWENFNGKEITWRQRIIPQSGEVEELD